MTVGTQKPKTPAQVARAWAKRNGEFVGEVIVSSTTSKGKGGWGRAGRTSRFFVATGRVAADRENRRVQPRAWNGLCNVCGTLYLDQVLTWAWAADPRAGQPADIPEGKHIDLKHWPGWQKVIAADAYVAACPRCIEDHRLRLESANTRLFDQGAKTHFIKRLHPELARFRDIERRAIIGADDVGAGGAATC